MNATNNPHHPISDETLFCDTCGRVAFQFQILADETDRLKEYLEGQKVHCRDCEPAFADEFFIGMEEFGITMA